MFQLNSNETIRLIIRRHKLNFVFEFTPIVVMVIALAVALWLLTIYSPTFWRVYGIYVWFLSPLLGLMITIKIFAIIIDWLLDATVVTDQRLITIHQHNIFHREIAALQLDRVQDVVVELKGVLEHFFHFGTVSIKTASETSEFVLAQVPDPLEVKEKIMQLVQERARGPFQKYEPPPPIGVSI